MKTKITVLLNIFLLITVISCSTENIENTDIITDDPVSVIFEEENPLPGYFNATGFNHIFTPCSNATSYEIGLKFKPTVKGQINSIVVKIPNANPDLVVTIWDATTKLALRTEHVNVTASNTEITKNIIPVVLIKNQAYAITMNTTNYHMRHETDWAQPQYPITVGNIKIITALLSDGPSPGYPSMGAGNFYNGDCGFNFLQTE